MVLKKSIAIYLTLLGAVCLSLNGLLIRLLDSATGFHVLFYRSITMTFVIILFIGFHRRKGINSLLRDVDRWDFSVAACVCLALSCYVFSIFFTSVASTLFILGATPLIAAFLGWFFLRERVSLWSIGAIVCSIAGLTLMVYDGFSLGKNFGNLLAFTSAVSFATMFIVARSSKKPDVLTGTLMGGIFAGAFGFSTILILNLDLDVSWLDLIIMLCMGMFAIGLGVGLITLAAPFLPPHEATVLVLLESFLGPIWVWIFLGEVMTSHEILGGSLVLISVLLISYRAYVETFRMIR